MSKVIVRMKNGWIAAIPRHAKPVKAVSCRALEGSAQEIINRLLAERNSYEAGVCTGFFAQLMQGARDSGAVFEIVTGESRK